MYARPKSVDFACGGNWFVFGVHPNGNVDVSCADGDVFTDMPPAMAEKVIALRDTFLAGLYEVCEKDE